MPDEYVPSSEEEYARRFSDAYLQVYLAQVESKEHFPWITKDLAYSNLDSGRIEEILRSLNTFSYLVYCLKKLDAGEKARETGKKVVEDDAIMQMVRSYSSPHFILNRVMSIAIVSQSHKGWARRLTVTRKSVYESMENKRKLFGKKEEDVPVQ